MDWKRAVDRNREALQRVLAMLFTVLGFVRDGSPTRVSKQDHQRILSMLRPAESAARRLIVVVAHGLVLPRCSAPSPPAAPIPRGIAKSPRLPCFALFDPRKRFVAVRVHIATPEPRILSFDETAPTAFEGRRSSCDETVNAERLRRRLQALHHALGDLTHQARRLARWKARRKPGRRPPLRPGWPPGHRSRPVYEVDEILTECHALAKMAEARSPPRRR